MQRWAHLINGEGRVLDLACGQGRHAFYLAARGRRIIACDRDADALDSLQGVQGVETVLADLEIGGPWPFGGQVFCAVLVVNYLHRPLFRDIAAAVAPGGVLIYETFAAGNERYGKPSNPEFLLRPGELLEEFGRNLTVVGFEYGRVSRPKPALVQRLCAVRSTASEIDLDCPL